MSTRRILATIAIGALFASACSLDSDNPASVDTPAATTTTSSEVVVAETVEGVISIEYNIGQPLVAAIPVDLGGGEIMTVECEIDREDEVTFLDEGLMAGTEVEVRETGSGDWECLRILGQVKRAIIADRIDLAVIDPENMIGDAEECVVDAINAFLEGEVADLDADQIQWVYWIGEFAGRCGVTAGIVFDPLSGGSHLGDMGEGNIFGP